MSIQPNGRVSVSILGEAGIIQQNSSNLYIYDKPNRYFFRAMLDIQQDYTSILSWTFCYWIHSRAFPCENVDFQEIKLRVILEDIYKLDHSMLNYPTGHFPVEKMTFN